MRIRIKFGRNPYSNVFTCSYCKQKFNSGGFIIRVEQGGIVVDVPICPACFDKDILFEGTLDMSKHYQSHPVGLA